MNLGRSFFTTLALVVLLVAFDKIIAAYTLKAYAAIVLLRGSAAL